MIRKTYIRHFFKDSFILIGGIFVAVLLVQLGSVERFIEATRNFQIFTSIVGGMFFTSVLTIAPASVALVAISQSMPGFLVAFWGACGAAIVDYILLSFVRNGVERDVEGLMKPALRRKVISLFHFGFLKWVVIVLGAFMIMSPLPDEIGIALLGFSKIRPRHLFLLTFVLHFFGIWALVSVAGAILQ